MRLAIKDLNQAIMPLTQLANTRGMKSIVAYRIAKNYKSIKKETDDYERIRIKLLEEHSNKDDDGKAIIKDNVYDVIDGHIDIINKELDELMDEKIELDIKKVTLKDIEVVGLAPVELELLEFMIDFEDKEEK